MAYNIGTPEDLSLLWTTLMRYGFNVVHVGTMYLAEAIIILDRDGYERIFRQTLRGILQEIATANGTTVWAVDRAMRHAIEHAWLVGIPEDLEELCPGRFKTGRPSVRRFLACASWTLRDGLDNFRKVK